MENYLIKMFTKFLLPGNCTFHSAPGVHLLFLVDFFRTNSICTCANMLCTEICPAAKQLKMIWLHITPLVGLKSRLPLKYCPFFRVDGECAANFFKEIISDRRITNI